MGVLPIRYLLERAAYRVYHFFYDWYVGGLLFVWHYTLTTLESLDRFWALRITAKNIFEPLYQDQTMLGRILGFIFRSIRILIALLLYGAIIFCGTTAYLLFALLPLYIVYSGFFNPRP